MRPRLILLTSWEGDALERLKAIYAADAELAIVRDLAGLEAVDIADGMHLLSFGTGVIVPAALLTRLRRPAYNLHAASPDFPGRDPHHFAIYSGCARYGATLHLMTERVDAGPIVGVEMFHVSPNLRPTELLGLANEAGFRLLERVGTRLLASEPLPAMPDIAWGEPKRSRTDFHAACRLSPLVDDQEFERRFRAFDGEGYDNLRTTLHGWTFRIDKAEGRRTADPQFAEFTEAGFREIVRALKRGGYRFARFGEKARDRHVVLRHDVDASLQRAASLAAIEAEEGAVATYFLNPRSDLYSLLEPESGRLIARILEGGHDIGLHFDGGAHAVQSWTRERLEQALGREKQILETIIERPVRAFSYHNPDTSNLLSFDDEEIAGAVNGYAQRLRADYVYASDSNGYWRFSPMRSVIDAGHERLYLLTHPEWWTPDPMPPSERIDRCLLGRARAARKRYDDLLRRFGRKNLV